MSNLPSALKAAYEPIKINYDPPNFSALKAAYQPIKINYDPPNFSGLAADYEPIKISYDPPNFSALKAAYQPIKINYDPPNFSGLAADYEPIKIDRIPVGAVLVLRMRSDSRFSDAAWYLAEATSRWHAATDERELPLVIHDAVGALEETARRIARMPRGSLPRALNALVRRDVISRKQREQMLQAYAQRNQVPGAGHGAGRAPKEVASFVLHRVETGLRDLLDAVNSKDDGE